MTEHYENDGVTRLETVPVDEVRRFDPGFDDTSYWARFRFRVMTAAAEELDRRRRAVDVSVVGVMERWSRTLAPVAAVAAAIAGFVLLQDVPGPEGHVDVEEALIAELDELVLPAFMDEAELDGLQFASESW